MQRLYLQPLDRSMQEYESRRGNMRLQCRGTRPFHSVRSAEYQANGMVPSGGRNHGPASGIRQKRGPDLRFILSKHTGTGNKTGCRCRVCKTDKDETQSLRRTLAESILSSGHNEVSAVQRFITLKLNVTGFCTLNG